VILRVDPAALSSTAAPLREAVELAREVQGARAELAGLVARAGSERLRRSTESFLEAWASGLQGVHDRGQALAAALDAAAAGYADAEERLRREAAAGPQGGPP